jgi:uncharacterized lipoprotein NlpE involved in copper resistance
MKKIVAFMLLVSLVLSGCASQMDLDAKQDRETFLQCQRNNPTSWGDRCNTELQMYQTSSANAQAESQNRSAQMQAIAGGLLAGALVGASAYAASRPVYAPVYVVPCRWNCW